MLLRNHSFSRFFFTYQGKNTIKREISTTSSGGGSRGFFLTSDLSSMADQDVYLDDDNETQGVTR